MDEPRLIPLKYCSAQRAAKMLHVDVEDIYHWLSEGFIKFLFKGEFEARLFIHANCASKNIDDIGLEIKGMIEQITSECSLIDDIYGLESEMLDFLSCEDCTKQEVKDLDGVCISGIWESKFYPYEAYEASMTIYDDEFCSIPVVIAPFKQNQEAKNKPKLFATVVVRLGALEREKIVIHFDDLVRMRNAIIKGELLAPVYSKEEIEEAKRQTLPSFLFESDIRASKETLALAVTALAKKLAETDSSIVSESGNIKASEVVRVVKNVINKTPALKAYNSRLNNLERVVSNGLKLD